MGRSHIPDFDNSADNNSIADTKQQSAGNVSVNMPINEWLCKRLDRLNMTLVAGCTSKSSEAS